MRTLFVAAFILAICFFANCSADGGVCAEAGFQANDVDSYRAVKNNLLSKLADSFDYYKGGVRIEFKTIITLHSS
jgi:hypothetical protein